ncbi:MAG: flagellar basal body-associated FliL family protein [Fibromonadales bacterium]|nr:flagellar basal body-associated FliL family protein [Fibromonadales bacterium]
MPAMDDDKKTEAAPAVPDEGAAKKASIIKWVIVGAILLLFIGMQVAMSIFFTSKLNPPPAVNLEDAEAKKQEEFLKAQKEVGVTLAAPIEVTVNIAGEDGRFVKCGVQLEYSPSFTKLGDELEARKPRIKDIVIDLLSSRTLSELMTNEGKQSVREQILKSVNDILPDTDEKGKPLGKVSRSYFDSFMIQ